MKHIPHQYHTIVVGAGPAGIMAAASASRAGSVLLADSSSLPRDKSCGGMLNAFSQQFVGRYGSIPERLVREPSEVFFRYLDWDRRIYKPTELRFLNVDRALFDEWMLGLLPHNVTVLPEAVFRDLEQHSSTVSAIIEVGGERERFMCEALVGADGARSQVRRALGVESTATYVTLQDRLELHGELPAFFDCVYMRDVGDSFGYAYVVPKGDQAFIGSVFYPRTRQPHLKHDDVVSILRAAMPQLGQQVKREAAAALYVRSAGDVVPGAGRVLLAGEAGGFMSPTSGEGISYAMNTGLLAGEAIASSDGAGALAGYTAATAHIGANIRRKLKWLPIMESRTGKYVAGFVPAPLISRVTLGL